MKKIKIDFSSIDLIAVGEFIGGFLIIILILLWLTGGCNDIKQAIKEKKLYPRYAVGSYIFSEDTYKNYINIDIDKPILWDEYASASTTAYCYISVETKKILSDINIIFEDCYIDYTININDSPYSIRVHLDKTGAIDSIVGDCTFKQVQNETYYSCFFNIDPTYKIKSKYEMVGMGGIIEITPYHGAVLKQNGIKYRYQLNEDKEIYSLYTKHKFKDTIARIKTEVQTINGTVEVDLSKSEFSGRKKVKVLIIEGTMNLDNPGYYRVIQYLRTKFPGIQALVIENVSSSDYCEISCAFPESGIDIYVNDNTYNSMFTSQMKHIYFVNNVYSYDEFDEKKYS